MPSGCRLASPGVFPLAQTTSKTLPLKGITGPGRLEFGIEAYYLQEGQGSKYEEAMRDHRLAAEIAVTADGRAALLGLRIERD